MILRRLKSETLAEHMALEQIVDLQRFLQTQAAYRWLIACFYGIYAPLEAHLVAHPGWAQSGFAFETRLKTPLLANDLRALGLSAASIANLPRCTGLPPRGDFAYTVGCAYVLEGATLGGQLVARQAQLALGLSPEQGCAFFHSYGAAVGSMWRAFQGLLVQVAVDGASEDAIVAGAHATFQLFGQWLGRAGAEGELL